MSTHEQATRLDRFITNHFRWTEEMKWAKTPDRWDNRYPEMLEGKVVEDDCDGRGFSAAFAAMEDYGFEPENVMVFTVLTEVGQRLPDPPPRDHLVAGLQVGHITWISDNRYAGLMLASQLPYQWQLVMKFDRPGEWYPVT